MQIILNDNVSAQNVEVFLMLHHLKIKRNRIVCLSSLYYCCTVQYSFCIAINE